MVGHVSQEEMGYRNGVVVSRVGWISNVAIKILTVSFWWFSFIQHLRQRCQRTQYFYFYFHFTEWGNFKSWWWVERAGQRGQRFSLCPRPPRACWSPWHWGRIPKCIPVIPALAMYCSSAHSNTPTIWLGLHEFEVLRISTPTLILPPSPLQLESSCRAWDGDFSGPCNTAAH